MPITRTPIYDDSGGGTDGTVIDNAWKQELYGQIDAGFPTKAPWTPLDVSGAGLTLGGTCYTCRIGPAVIVVAHVNYPATANSAFAALGGLPFPNRHVSSGFYQTFGPVSLYFLDVNQTAFNVLNAATGAPRTNAELSGVSLRFSGVYLTDN